MEIVFSFQITIQLNIYNIKVSTMSQQIMLLVDGQTAHLFSSCSIENRPRSRSGDYPPPSVGGKTRGEREMWQSAHQITSLFIRSLVCSSNAQSVHQMPCLQIRCLVCRSDTQSVDQMPILFIKCLVCRSDAQSVHQMPCLQIRCLVCFSDPLSVHQILSLYINKKNSAC